ncbi:hypothetical protein LSAT2_019152 [Lamellibrachia satsuma]|nr:hypothetical protein LSAT2_019152 [Lamellibrachia satsuma]
MAALPGKTSPKRPGASLFQLIHLPSACMVVDTAEWESKATVRHVHGLTFVNDFAKCNVVLMHNFNFIITKHEELKQLQLQIVEAHQRLFPDSRKSTQN